MRNKKLLLSFAFVFLALICLAVPSFAKDLDEIQKYYVTVDTRKDGTLDMTYYFEWKVLDSVSEGPLEWVKIGVPNSHVDTIKALTKNIAKIEYTSLGGDYIRIDFDRAYRAGEVIKFSFSTHQSYMYKITSDGCKYTFTPGWFSDIAVKDARIFWDSKQVVQATSSEINSDNYYVWKDTLRKNERITAEVKYGKNTFTLSGSMQATDNYSSMNEYVSDTSGSSIIIFIHLIIPLYSYEGFNFIQTFFLHGEVFFSPLQNLFPTSPHHHLLQHFFRALSELDDRRYPAPFCNENQASHLRN